MKKIIRLTESDLTRLVRRVINESGFPQHQQTVLSWEKIYDNLFDEVLEIIEYSQNTEEFENNIDEFMNNNESDLNKIPNEKREGIMRFISSIIERHDFQKGKDNITIPLSEIPRSLKSIIFRRLNPSYHKYL